MVSPEMLQGEDDGLEVESRGHVDKYSLTGDFSQGDYNRKWRRVSWIEIGKITTKHPKDTKVKAKGASPQGTHRF
jgi:hypothetical protein